MIKLKNGTEESEHAVRTTMISLCALDPVTRHELVMRCRDPDHVLFGNSPKFASLKQNWRRCGRRFRVETDMYQHWSPEYLFCQCCWPMVIYAPVARQGWEEWCSYVVLPQPSVERG